MIRWVLIAVLLGAAGCKGSAKPSCDPAQPPSREWAYAEYLAQGGKTFEQGGLRINTRESYKGLSDLVHQAGPHGDSSFLGTVWKCKLYRDARQLAKALLLEEGWLAANAPMRHTLATKIYGEMITRPLVAANKDWDPTQEFTAPEVKTLPDTGVRLVHWYAHFVDVIHHDGSATPAFTREEVVIGPDGTIGESKKLASYKRSERVN